MDCSFIDLMLEQLGLELEQPIFMEMIMGMVTAFVFFVLSLMGSVVLNETRQCEYKH